MALLQASNDVDIDVDDFIKTFTVTDDSPARPHLSNMNSQGKDAPSSPFDHSFYTDISGNSSSDWLVNMGLESVLGGVSPSSRGSSLDTPNIPQGGFVSIDPTRLKEANSLESGANSEMGRSPAWSQPDLQQTIDNTATSTQPIDIPHSNPSPAPDMRAPALARKLESGDMAGVKRKRQGSLPDIYIPAQQQLQPQPRGLQRSMSTGTPIIVTHIDTSDETLNHSFLGIPSPVDGPMSAPPMAHHPMSFAPYQPAPGTAIPLLTPQPINATGHMRTFSYSGLATIPEAPSSAPPDVQWMQFPQHQVRHGNTDITTYYVPPPPATPSLPSGNPSPMMPQTADAFHGLRSAMPAPLRRPNSCPSAEPSSVPGRMGYTLQLQQQEAQRQYLQPHPQTFQIQQPQSQSQFGTPLSAHSEFSPQLHYSPQLQPQQFPTHPGPLSIGPMSAGPMSNGPMSAGPMSTGPMSAGPMSAGPMSAGPFSAGHFSGGSMMPMGRTMPTQSSHTRRSSDSELAFSLGPQQHNVGAMLRSTSVPQGEQGFYTSLPPAPTVNGCGPMTFVPYEPLGYGRPRDRDNSPPRKRIASKRVGTCLKPGPKSKPKPKSEGELTFNINNGGPSHEEPLNSIDDAIPTNLIPVSFEEFQASFTITPAGTIIPMLGIEVMTERLMYATPEAVVDACFRWCYQIGSEFNHAAEKQSKYFRCCFDECVGSNGRIFMRKSAVDSHVRTHIGFRPFRCEADPDCDARFVRKHDRDRHVATTHRNEKSFLCTDCGQNFARSDALLRHRAKRDACKARTGQL